MDLPVSGSTPSPCFPPEPPDAELDVRLPVDPPDPPVPPDPPPALWANAFHCQISSPCSTSLHQSEQKGLLLLKNNSATWNFNTKSKKFRALSLNLEASVPSPDNPHISSSLMGSDDQRFRPSSAKAYWLQHASVYRVHIAQSRDVVLEVVPLFCQLSQAIRVYTVFVQFLMNIRVKSRQTRPFSIARSYGSRVTQLLLPANSFRQSSIEDLRRSHPPMVSSVTNLLVEVKESLSGHDLEAPIYGSLVQSYIGSLLIVEAIAMRSVFHTALTLEFPKLKVFSNISTLIRAISGNFQSKEIIGFVKDIRSISSGFASVFFSSLVIILVYILAKKALQVFLSL